MLNKLRISLIVLVLFIFVLALVVTNVIVGLGSFTSVFVFVVSLMFITLCTSLVGIYQLRRLISQLGAIGSYLAGPNEISEDTKFIQAFTNGYAQKVLFNSSEEGVSVFFKYSTVKQFLLIPWDKIRKFEIIPTDELICLKFYKTNVKLYIPLNNDFIRLAETKLEF